MKYLLSIMAATLGSPGDIGIPEQKLDASSLATFLSGIYYIAGIIAVITIIVAGISYVTANGDAGKVTKAKNAIIYSAVGLVLIITAFAITNFIMENMK